MENYPWHSHGSSMKFYENNMLRNPLTGKSIENIVKHVLLDWKKVTIKFRIIVIHVRSRLQIM